MSDLPLANYISNAGRTEGEVKAALETWLAATKQLPGGQAEYPLVIASGVVTPTGSTHAIDTEGGAAADDLATVAQTNLPDGSMLFLHTVTASRVVVVKHAAGGTGQISLAFGHDKILRRPTDWLLLKRTGTLWEEVLTSGAGVPTGAMVVWPLAVAPADWLFAEGQAVSRATYAALFELYGTFFGVGDGSTTFNMPNVKGRMLVGYDTTQAEFNLIGKVGGEKTHILLASEMPTHSHGVTDPGHTHLQDAGNPTGGAAEAFLFGAQILTGQRYVTSAQTGISIQSAGGGGAHNNLPPYFTSPVIVKT